MTDRDDLRREAQAQQDKADAQRDAGKKEAQAESARGAAKANEKREAAEAVRGRRRARLRIGGPGPYVSTRRLTTATAGSPDQVDGANAD